MKAKANWAVTVKILLAWNIQALCGIESFRKTWVRLELVEIDKTGKTQYSLSPLDYSEGTISDHFRGCLVFFNSCKGILLSESFNLIHFKEMSCMKRLSSQHFPNKKKHFSFFTRKAKRLHDDERLVLTLERFMSIFTQEYCFCQGAHAQASSALLELKISFWTFCGLSITRASGPRDGVKG